MLQNAILFLRRIQFVDFYYVWRLGFLLSFPYPVYIKTVERHPQITTLCLKIKGQVAQNKPPKGSFYTEKTFLPVNGFKVSQNSVGPQVTQHNVWFLTNGPNQTQVKACTSKPKRYMY